VRAFRLLVDDAAFERFAVLARVTKTPLDELALYIFGEGLDAITNDKLTDAPAAFRWWLELHKDYTRRSAITLASAIRGALRQGTIERWVTQPNLPPSTLYRRRTMERTWAEWCSQTGHNADESQLDAKSKQTAVEEAASYAATNFAVLDGLR